MSKSTQRGYLRIAIALLVIMLFPLYWMVNASFQVSGNTLNATLIPTNRVWPATRSRSATMARTW